MKTIQKQLCPLCEKHQAEFVLTDWDNRKHFKCSSCTEFEIAIDAEKRISTVFPDWREECIRMAKKTPEGFILEITTLLPGENSDLQAVHVPRTK